MSLFAEGVERGLAKLVGLVGFFLALIALVMVARFWNAKSTYEEVPATITDVSVSADDKTAWVLTYEYQWGSEKISDNITFPEEKARRLQSSGIIPLLKDPDTNDTLVVDTEDFVKAFSLKMGIMGAVLMLGAYIFMRMHPKPR